MKNENQSQRSLQRIAAVGAIAALTVITAAQPLTYTIIALPCPVDDQNDVNSNATGLNEHGHVVGVAEEFRWIDLSYRRVTHGVIWDADGQIIFHVGDAPDGGFLFAKGINNNDDIVGQGSQSAAPNPGYMGVPKTYQHGVGLFNPDPNQPQHGWAWAINDSRQVGHNAGNGMFIWDPVDGTRAFGLPGGPGEGEVWELNNAGVACGDARGADGWLHSYRYDYATDTIVDLHDPIRFRHTGGYGINELGDIAGWADQWDNYGHPVIWAADGREIVLATADLTPAHVYARAEHINGNGDVVGKDVSYLTEPPIGWIAYDALGVGIADVTTQGAGVGDSGFGVPDLLVTASDLNFYVNGWVAQDLAIADVTTQGAGEGDPGYGVPDGLVTAADISYFVNAWVAGPTIATKIDLRTLLSAADQASWPRLSPFEINDAGQICGIGVVDGKTRGFLMTPVPNN